MIDQADKNTVELHASARPGEVPALICLSGAHRGVIFRLREARTYHLQADPIQGAVLREEIEVDAQAPVLAHLHPSGEGFELESKREAAVRLNGALVLNAVLSRSDVIEIETPPLLLKYDLVNADGRNRAELNGLFSDCLKRTRFESGNWAGFALKLPVNMLAEVTDRSTSRFRIAVALLLAILTGLALMQCNTSRNLQRQFAQELEELSTETDWVRRQQSEFISRAELDRLSQAISSGLTEAQQRVTALETRSGAAQRLVSEASRAVIFLQGAWVYQERETGRKMRYLVGEEGGPLLTLDGKPLMSFDGEGPIASNQFSGTAFVISPDGRLVTNQHVAQPWEGDPAIESMSRVGVEPVIERFIGYLPGIEVPFNVRLEEVSSEADLAMLSCSDVTGTVAHIPIAARPPAPGDEVYVLGYPTGLRALVARSSPQFIERVSNEELDFWSIAAALAEQDLVRPLASRGIVGQVSADAIAYDADTTRGGSGGPVLNSAGELVAVNVAIIPEYGGSNLGVPVAALNRLLQEADQE